MLTKREDDWKMWSDFITESPWLTHPLPDKFNDDMENIKVEKVLEKYPKIETYKNYDIHENKSEIYFIRDGIISAYYHYSEKPDGSIQTKMTWNNRAHKSSFRDVFANYIIPRFKVVESDIMLTPDAFDLWKRLIAENPQYSFYAKIGEKYTELEYPHAVYTFKEKMGMNDGDNSTFIVTFDKR